MPKNLGKTLLVESLEHLIETLSPDDVADGLEEMLGMKPASAVDEAAAAASAPAGCKRVGDAAMDDATQAKVHLSEFESGTATAECQEGGQESCNIPFW